MKYVLIVLALCLCISSIGFCDLSEKEEEEVAKRTGTFIAGIIHGGLAIWGFTQVSAYGVVTGVIFALRSHSNLKEATK